ncbi:MAG: D-glycerate dehydrogenase [Lautropia sp.]|nr:D-glycerate dehydrogenase [Lautropia sp.]
MSSAAKPRLLLTRRIDPRVLAHLETVFEIDANQADEVWSTDELHARLADKEAVLVVASDRVDAAFLAASPRLKMVSTGSVGVNHIDLSACAARGIVVTHTPDVLNEATADMAWALLMATARRVTEAEQWLRAGHWGRWAWDQFLGADVHGSTLGIVGMGRIGTAIARRARGFGMSLRYHNRRPSPEAQALGAGLCSLPELLAASDHVVLVVPYSAETHHLIDEAALSRMKPTATLINIARGGVVDEGALAAALQAGRLAGAGLDVYEGEPTVNPALLACHNVVLTPHIGSATHSARLAMAMLAARNLTAVFSGQAPLTRVSG